MGWSDVTGVILAAGRGTRMLGLSNEFPKPLLPIGNVPLLVGHLGCCATSASGGPWWSSGTSARL